MARRGRPTVLDERKRAEILAIVAVGCSREVAAKYVRCALSTIQETAKRDSVFAEELAQREQFSEIGYLENIRKAARCERYWRAAAWALERIKPETYAQRSPDVITLDQICDVMAQFAEIVVEEVPARYRSNVLKRLDGISEALKDASKKRKARRQ